jgi:hypothetical protein
MFDGNAEVGRWNGYRGSVEHVLAATYSEPKVAVSTVDCNLEINGLVGTVYDSCNRLSTDEVMVQVGIHERCEHYSFATRWGASSGTSSLLPCNMCSPSRTCLWDV